MRKGKINKSVVVYLDCCGQIVKYGDSQVAFLELEVSPIPLLEFGHPPEFANTLLFTLMHTYIPIHTDKLNLVGIVDFRGFSIYPFDHIPSGHIKAPIQNNVILDSKYLRAHNFGLAVLRGGVIVYVVLIRCIRNVIVHKLAALPTKSLLGH